jgi:hypothetical protein
VTEKSTIRDDYTTEPENWGEWALRLDALTGFGDPRAVARHAAKAGTIAGLPVATVSIDKAQITATNGWSAGWTYRVEGEWLHIHEVAEVSSSPISARAQAMVLEDIERIITDVRDESPRRSDDADSGEIAQALIDVVDEYAMATAAKALRDAAESVAKDPGVPLTVAQGLVDRAMAIEADELRTTTDLED